MSSVESSTAANYNYMNQRVEDLEREYDAERKKLREKAKDYEAKVTENHQGARQKEEASTQKTLDKFRETSEQEGLRAKEVSRDQAEKLKNLYYDRMGRTNGLDAEELRDQLTTEKRGNEAKEGKYKQLVKETEVASQTKDEQRQAEHAMAMESLAQKTRQGIQEYNEVRTAQQNQLFHDLKENQEKRNADVQKEATDRLEFQRQQSKLAVTSAESEKERAIAQARETSEKRASIHEAAQAEAITKKLGELKAAQEHGREDLKAQIDQMSSASAQYAKEKGAGTRDAISQNERDWLDRERLVLDSHSARERQNVRLNDERDHYWSSLLHDESSRKDEHLANALAKNNLRNEEQRKNLNYSHDVDTAQFKHQIKQNAQNAEKQSEIQAARGQQRLSDSLANQAKGYTKTMRDAAEANSENVDRLQKQVDSRLGEKETISDISPAVEEIVRNKYFKGEEKTFGTEFERNRASEESIRRAYTGRLKDALYEKDAASTRMLREREGQAQMTQSSLQSHILEVEANQKDIIKDREIKSTKAQENSLRNYASTLERQRHEYEDMMESMRAEASTRLQNQLQDAEFKRKAEHREFVTKEVDMIRSHERELNMMKVENDAKLEEAKNLANKAIQESEKRARAMIEEQQKGFDQRVSTLEEQHKQREKLIANNYEDALDKLKRTNLNLMAKRGS